MQQCGIDSSNYSYRQDASCLEIVSPCAMNLRESRFAKSAGPCSDPNTHNFAGNVAYPPYRNHPVLVLCDLWPVRCSAAFGDFCLWTLPACNLRLSPSLTPLVLCSGELSRVAVLVKDCPHFLTDPTPFRSLRPGVGRCA